MKTSARARSRRVLNSAKCGIVDTFFLNYYDASSEYNLESGRTSTTWSQVVHT